MKINYNGQELETITEGYWPDGLTLAGSEDGINFSERKVFYLRDGHAIFDGKENGTCWVKLSCWAILPPKPAPRRLTNREVGELCKKGWDVQYGSSRVFYGAAMVSAVDIENDPCDIEVRKLRAPNSDEWLEPTTDLLEMVK